MDYKRRGVKGAVACLIGRYVRYVRYVAYVACVALDGNLT